MTPISAVTRVFAVLAVPGTVFAMSGTVSARERRKPRRRRTTGFRKNLAEGAERPYAAEELEDELEEEDEAEAEDVDVEDDDPDDLESEDEDFVSEADFADDGAGELLDEEPRLSLR
ncbi:hypothetical protein GCM10009646_36890 [Streptomyces aureus]